MNPEQAEAIKQEAGNFSAHRRVRLFGLCMGDVVKNGDIMEDDAAQ